MTANVLHAARLDQTALQTCQARFESDLDCMVHSLSTPMDKNRLKITKLRHDRGMPSPTIGDLRRYAISRSLFAPVTLAQALERMGFVQADPIRSPARAQDLTLRHRVKGYCAGDLERCYAQLAVAEDFFINYGFVTTALHARMHPRIARLAWTAERWTQAHAVRDFVAQRGEVHPRDVDAHFAHGAASNAFGGQSRASTQLLDGMHYRGLLRVTRRSNGIRLYAAHSQQAQPTQVPAELDLLVDALVNLYAPLPLPGLRQLVTMLKHGVPQWQGHLRSTLQRAIERLPNAEVDGVRWFWPVGEDPCARRWKVPEAVRLLAPFDPVVWDRDRFERLWGWAYRFEAYTPPAKRVRGYYAMPVVWRDQVVGWGNLSVGDGRLQAEMGYVAGQSPQDAAYLPALEAELAAMAVFLACQPA